MLENPTTEDVNPASTGLDTLSPIEIVRLMNAEDAKAVAAVDAASVVDQIEIGGGAVDRFGSEKVRGPFEGRTRADHDFFVGDARRGLWAEG